jgi:hypothetical protein
VEGGHILWVAPSGGRDRTDKHTGKMAVAPFDSRAVDMFRVLSTKSQHPTHFFPLSMLTAQVGRKGGREGGWKDKNDCFSLFYSFLSLTPSSFAPSPPLLLY